MFCQGVLHARGVIETVSIHYTKEMADGKAFICKQEVVNGAITNHWLVDNNQVEQMVYEVELVKARVHDAQKEHEDIARKRLQTQSMQTAALRTGYRKMLIMQCERIDELLSRLDDVRIKPYIAFDTHTMGVSTMTSKEFENMVSVVYKHAKELIALDDSQATLFECSQMVDHLDAVPDQLQKLFYASIDNAMLQCSDTKLLKELLELITHAER